MKEAKVVRVVWIEACGPGTETGRKCTLEGIKPVTSYYVQRASPDSEEGREAAPRYFYPVQVVEGLSSVGAFTIFDDLKFPLLGTCLHLDLNFLNSLWPFCFASLSPRQSVCQLPREGFVHPIQHQDWT